MAKRLNSQEKLDIAYMPYNKKVLTFFKMFPEESPYSEELYHALLSERKKGNRIIVLNNLSVFVELEVNNFGSIRKHCQSDYTSSFLSFYDYLNGTEINSITYNKKDSDFICDSIIPFILSKGKDLSRIPLLINIFPSFAQYALTYQSTKSSNNF